jgi:3-oxoacyl-[acyl-carrier-protein] synthase III
VESITSALARAGLTTDDVDLFVPHQANLRIIEAVADRLGVPMERTILSVHYTGNTSAASIPLALTDAVHAGRLADGDVVVMTGFGAGMTWATAVLRWGSGPLPAPDRPGIAPGTPSTFVDDHQEPA